MAVLLLCTTALAGCANNDKKITWAQDKDTVIRSVHDIKVNQQKSEAELLQKVVDADAQIKLLEEENNKQQRQIDSLIAQLKAMQTVKRKGTVRKKTVAAAPSRKTTHRTTEVDAPIAAPVAAVKPQVDPAIEADAEKNAYTAAYLALKSGRFDEASTAFNAQLDKYPDGEHADQAWYWLGETRYAQHDYQSALLAFKYVADHYSNSVKHAASLLKLAQISEAQKNASAATLYYNRLIREHADSTPAEQARERLAEMNAKPVAKDQAVGDQPAENPQ
ncbi:tetratricopeptide repeat protein [Mariprofundus micogutta]|nr:tetratricopeptide repeat protein [Mariprofundus micogutta]